MRRDPQLNEQIKAALKDGVIDGARESANEIVKAGVVVHPEEIYKLHSNTIRMLNLIDMVYDKRIDSEADDDSASDVDSAAE
jgi:hypothetical protein